MTKAEGKSLIIFKTMELLRSQGLHSSSFPLGYLMATVLSLMMSTSSYWGFYLPHHLPCCLEASGGSVSCSCGSPFAEFYTTDISALLVYLTYCPYTLATGFASSKLLTICFSHTVVINCVDLL